MQYLSRNKVARHLLEIFGFVVGAFGCFLIFFALIGVTVACETGNWGLYIKDILVILGVGLICTFGGFKFALKVEALGGKG